MVSTMVVVSNVIDRNFLFDDWMVSVCLSTFLSARASAISLRVCLMPFMEVVTVLVGFVMFFHSSYWLLKIMSST